MRGLIGGLIMVLMSLAEGAQAAEIVYVQGAQAPLFSAPQLGKAPIEVLAHGTPLVVVAEKSRWYRVTVADRTGWVVKLMVAPHPPVVSEAAPDDAMETLMERARVRPSTYSTTAAARGLRAGGSGFKDAVRVDYERVTEMEKLQPDARALAEFFNTDPGDE